MIAWCGLDRTGHAIALVPGAVGAIAAWSLLAAPESVQLLPLLVAVLAAALATIVLKRASLGDPNESHRGTAFIAGVMLAVAVAAQLHAVAGPVAPALAAVAGSALVLGLRRGDRAPLARRVAFVSLAPILACAVGLAPVALVMILPAVAAAMPLRATAYTSRGGRSCDTRSKRNGISRTC